MSKQDTFNRLAVDRIRQLSSHDRKAIRYVIDTSYTFAPSDMNGMVQDLQTRVYGKRFKKAIERAVKNKLKV